MNMKSICYRFKNSILLFLISILSTNISLAQKNHLSFSVNGIGNNNYLLKEDSYNHLQLESGFFIHPGGELLYSRDLSDSYTFHTGISYQYRQYFTDSSNKYYRYGELAIPAIISFHVLKKHDLKFDWSAGVYFNQLLHMVGFRASSTAWYNVKNFVDYRNPTKLGLDIYSDIKLGYPMSKGREIFIAPFWRYHLIKKDYYEGMTFHSLGLKIGYTFKSF